MKDIYTVERKGGTAAKRRIARRAGQVIPRGDKRWLVRWVEKYDKTTGERTYRSEIVAGSKREAEDFLAEKRSAIAGGIYVSPSKLTVGEVLDRWLERLGAEAGRARRGDVDQLPDDRPLPDQARAGCRPVAPADR